MLYNFRTLNMNTVPFYQKLIYSSKLCNMTCYVTCSMTISNTSYSTTVFRSVIWRVKKDEMKNIQIWVGISSQLKCLTYFTVFIHIQYMRMCIYR